MVGAKELAAAQMPLFCYSYYWVVRSAQLLSLANSLQHQKNLIHR
ncbi:hypothetical protein D0N43_06910 [Klebsiella aerogenes]|uniref:Uncharacterized protein n=1 Tax=Klebsiella aerogenes (strain ATCC 13048 / DSM 30053 / CCUG 1429 / JCM 1235 / KCTC 2190 / NBRC 13534 / NCIMB 10102 / NCTC 10006 / CDC 819-56) TaxID=1028307 RepID=A0A0H3FS68_KLEAK|nr:hypothetical protein EAE_03745 [Klebsiella aerogenes KCTC 2190]QEU21405.1 hypothetical protein FOB49_23460 [Klebsiella aerogenes]RFP75314.1 hypothetical protein D0N43_06910 [Klebsiella aerogenes]VDZ68012.1 Uncharacterised protein [Klebsiella aerogenes]